MSDFLKSYDLTLKTISPVHIGSGDKICKKNYIFNRAKREVSVFDEEKFFQLIMRRYLTDKYEQFMMGNENDLYKFLTDTCKLKPQDWEPALKYRINVSGGLDESETLKEINTFMRDAYGKPYIPGSSLKGMLTTIILQQMIMEDKNGNREYDERRFNSILEKKYINKLRLNSRRAEDAVNSIMRGVRISDSMPLSDDDITLSLKIDAKKDGTVKKLPLCRAAVRPGVEIHFNLSLDESIMHGIITKDTILKAIKSFSEYYEDTYLSHFKTPDHAKSISYDNCVLLGGGSGFFSKSLLYPYLGEDEALIKVVEIMCRSFRKHKHENDEFLGISPHTIKYTEYEGYYYPMGLCKVEINDLSV